MVREKPIQDGAEPCGNSVQVLNLMRLARITGEDRYRARADQAVSAVSAVLSQWPTALAEMLLAMDYRYDQVPEVIVVVPEAGGIELARPFIAELRRRFVPNRVVATVVEGKAQDELAALMPMVAGKLAQDGQATAYLCEHGLCQAPTREVSVFAEQLDALLS